MTLSKTQSTIVFPATHKAWDRKFLTDQLSLLADFLELQTGEAMQSEDYRLVCSQLKQPRMSGFQHPTEQELESIAGSFPNVYSEAVAFLSSGTSELFTYLSQYIPLEIKEMLGLHGLGPKRLRLVWKEMGIQNIQELDLAITQNRLLRPKGFGPKTQAKIKESILHYRLNHGPFRLSDLRPFATILEHELRELLGPNARFDFTGAFRRGCTLCDSLELIVDPQHYRRVMLHMIQSEGYEIMTAGSDLVQARMRNTDIPLLFHFKGHNYYLELWRSTGTAAHNALLEIDEGKHYRTEAEVYACAGLPYLPAALREGDHEIRLAMRNRLPQLVHHSDIKGLLHAHSTASDGSDNLEDMARHCQAMGMQYLGISDHGPSHVHGMGMQKEVILQQHREIDRLNALLAPFKILKGIELDIQEDGSLGLDNATLASFDFVIASLNAPQTISLSDATIRLIRAIRNPYTTIIGHPKGQLLQANQGHLINFEAVFDACKEYGVAVELNCNPSRMDLDWRLLREAVATGLQVAISPDAHSAPALHDYEQGISEARKGLLGTQQTLNAMDLTQLESYLSARRALRVS